MMEAAGPPLPSPMLLLESVADHHGICTESNHYHSLLFLPPPLYPSYKSARLGFRRSSSDEKKTTDKTMENNLLEEVLAYRNAPPLQPERKPRPQQEQALRCPRCDSNNTKFCYYNNYSLSQPRYFCKSCRRYWTKGGTLRNVPVGGGCRKNKRSSSSSKKLEDQALLQTLIPPSPDTFPLPQAQSFGNESFYPFNGFYYGHEARAIMPWEIMAGATAAMKQEPSFGNGELWHGLVNGFLI